MVKKKRPVGGVFAAAITAILTTVPSSSEAYPAARCGRAITLGTHRIMSADTRLLTTVLTPPPLTHKKEGLQIPFLPSFRRFSPTSGRFL